MDLERLRALLAMLGEHDVTEFSYEDGDLSLQLRLGPPPAPVATLAAAAPGVVAQAAPVPAAATAPQPAEPAAPAEEGVVVKSPMVGTFYIAPSPGAPAFVEVGQRVEAGATLCIIEAMKLMNTIEAEVSGRVAARLVGDGQPVEFGQPIFRIVPG
jgi:acetyl-CoA carboxylase biotin carboxyl carrier protein